MTDASSSQHRQSWDLIPWVINGTASESERRTVEEHLQGCSDCRGEMEFQQRLQRAVAQEGNVEADTQSSWARFRDRFDADPMPSLAARLGPRRVRHSEHRWMPWVMAAMLVQGVGLGVLGTALWSRAQMSSPNASGPSDADVWSLAPAGDSNRAATDAAVRTLRSNPSVRFAEPIGAPP